MCQTFLYKLLRLHSAVFLPTFLFQCCYCCKEMKFKITYNYYSINYKVYKAPHTDIRQYKENSKR